MRFAIEPREGHLHAALFGRDTADEMRAFLPAVHAACQEHGTPKILVSVRGRERARVPPRFNQDKAS